MINHFRTLLLNVSSTDSPAIIGEEKIDSNFTPIELPSYAKKVRTILFGSDPDRYMLNYRAKQIMLLIHNTSLEPYLSYFDDRLTYTKFRIFGYYDLPLYSYGSTVSSADGLARIGSIESDDAAGKMYFSWRITTDASQNATVHAYAPRQMENTQAYTVSAGRSSPIDLIGSNLQLTFLDTSNAEWTFTAIAKPKRNIGTIINTLITALSASDLAEIFRTRNKEPVQTYYNVWYTNKSSQYRLAALLLGMIHHLNELL